ELRGKRVWMVFLDVTELMDKRANWDGLVLQVAKEIQATEVLMVTPETSVNVVLQELMERRVTLGAQEKLVPLAQMEKVEHRERGEVLDHLAFRELKGYLDPLEVQEHEARKEEEETMGLKGILDQMVPREKRVKWGQRA
ncbi:hypothetical protein WJF12_23370, partial [Salmonella enterica subsp. enterica serovar Corvallis]